ncbi:hypothetical protein ACH5AL_36450 [Actinacidiphila glaucinigra]|uniref:hypothetical protein n=1 Tax=Actinacidiphila glaucinigra TaxID=235986 RepID=UPI00378A855C
MGGEKIVLPRPSRLTDHVLSMGRSYMEPVLDSAPAAWAGQDPARAPKIRQNGVHSLMIVPLRIRRTCWASPCSSVPAIPCRRRTPT